MDNKKVDYFFRLIHVCFWPIIWYKWIAITDDFIENILFIAFCSLSILFLIYLVYSRIKDGNNTKVKFFYRLITVLCFTIAILSFVLYPKSTIILYIKMFTIALYFYTSYRLVIYKVDDEGVVGIMSSILLAAMTFFYL